MEDMMLMLEYFKVISQLVWLPKMILGLEKARSRLELPAGEGRNLKISTLPIAAELGLF